MRFFVRIRPVVVLILIAVCLPPAIGGARPSSFRGTPFFAQQGRGSKSEPRNPSKDLRVKRMSHMGELAHRATKGQLHPDDRQDDPGQPLDITRFQTISNYIPAGQSFIYKN